MHVGDTIFIFCLALIIFGPKKLPEIGRQIGKLMVEFRRASNEFKMQIEEELRASEEAERQKEISAKTAMLPAAAAAAPALEATTTEAETATESADTASPVIAPPSTGVPVNRTFDGAGATAGTCTYEAVPEAASEVSAYPEQTNGFNPGLNTASNGAVAEVPLNQPAIAEEAGAAEAALSNASPATSEAAVQHG